MSAAAPRPGEPEWRRTFQPVRKNSIEVGDERVVGIWTGQLPDKATWFAVLRRELAKIARGIGRLRVLDAAREIGEAMWTAVNKKTGRLDPSYETLEAMTGHKRTTICHALHLLKVIGLLDWRRRFKRVDEERTGRSAPVEQTSNAYAIKLPEILHRALFGAAPKPPPEPPTQAEVAARLRQIADQEGAPAPIDPGRRRSKFRG